MEGKSGYVFSYGETNCAKWRPSQVGAIGPAMERRGWRKFAVDSESSKVSLASSAESAVPVSAAETAPLPKHSSPEEKSSWTEASIKRSVQEIVKGILGRPMGPTQVGYPLPNPLFLPSCPSSPSAKLGWCADNPFAVAVPHPSLGLNHPWPHDPGVRLPGPSFKRKTRVCAWYHFVCRLSHAGRCACLALYRK